MARFRLRFTFIIFFVLSGNPGLALPWDESGEFSVFRLESNQRSFNGDYNPLVPSPAPEPRPPDGPSVSCVDDLGGVGSLDSTCKLVVDLNLTRSVYIAGKGNFHVLPGVRLQCPVAGCSITVNVSGSFSLGENSTVTAGTFLLAADNASFALSSAVNTTGLAGDPPPETSGTPEGVEGAGGGHGGRGACCLTDNTKLPDDVWGGDVYSWSSLEKPKSYGSRGGSTSNEIDYGGAGGGTVEMQIVGHLEINGSVLADGANGGVKGGGGSGGSIYIKAHKM